MPESAMLMLPLTAPKFTQPALFDQAYLFVVSIVPTVVDAKTKVKINKPKNAVSKTLGHSPKATPTGEAAA